MVADMYPGEKTDREKHGQLASREGGRGDPKTDGGAYDGVMTHVISRGGDDDDDDASRCAIHRRPGDGSFMPRRRAATTHCRSRYTPVPPRNLIT